MKKVSFILAIMAVLGMCGLSAPVSSMAALSTYTFSNTVTDIGSNSWEHELSLSDFDPALSSMDGILITSAALDFNFDVVALGTYKVLVATTSADGAFLGNYVATSTGTEFDASFILTDLALAELNKDYAITVEVHLPVGGSVSINEATLSGDARVVPIPASALLLGTGLIGLIGFRRQRMKK